MLNEKFQREKALRRGKRMRMEERRWRAFDENLEAYEQALTSWTDDVPTCRSVINYLPKKSSLRPPSQLSVIFLEHSGKLIYFFSVSKDGRICPITINIIKNWDI
jgi:hypothetical protein